MPRLDRVRAGRQIRQVELAFLVGDRIVRVIEHADIRVHPAVHIALEGHHHFLLLELVRGLHALDRLPGVEFRVAFRQRVDVVQRRIAVENLERLADAHAEHVRMIPAVLLIDLRRRGRHVVGVVAEAVFHVHEHVTERLAVGADLVGFLKLRGRVRLDADRIGVHLDRFVLRRDAVERYHAFDVARRGGVDPLT